MPVLPAPRRPSTARTGASIRRLLVLIVAVPVIGLLVLAALQLRGLTTSTVDAARVETLVNDAMDLDAVRVALQQELIPTMGLAVGQDPKLAAQLGLGSVEVPVTPMAVALLQARTDRAVDALPDSALAGAPGSVRSAVDGVRADIRRGADLSATYQEASRLIDRLTAVENDLLRQADLLQPDAATSEAVAVVQLLVQVNQRASLETPLLLAAGLNNLAEVESGRTWQQVNREFEGLAAIVPGGVDPVLAASWRTANEGQDATTLRRVLARAPTQGVPQDPEALTEIFLADSGRSAAFGAVLREAADRAAAAAGAHRAAVTRDLAVLGVLALLVVLLSVLGVVLVGRSLTRPLDLLAAQATRVGEGELDDVPESGPREVRTVARGLSAAVATLRRIQQQTAAVTSGDLQSPVVNEPLPGALGHVVHQSVISMVQSIRERQRLQDDLAHQAAHDSLTGLPNRATVLSLLSAALERPPGTSIALLFVDLDYFKQANDTFGHAVGDQVLREAATRLLGAVRAEDAVARLGGDEFLVLVADADDDDVLALGERLVRVVSEPFTVDDAQVLIGASVGIAFGTPGRDDPDRLLVDADAAAYRAKSSGRSRVVVYDEPLRAELGRREALGRAIGVGLERGEFVMHYQPIVDLLTGDELGFEALIRWERPGHGLVGPDQFIPVAESTTLINDLGRWVLHEATRQLMAWTAADPAVAGQTVAVNISGRHLLSRRIVDDVRDALDASGLEPGRLTVEITETVLVDDRHAVLNMTTLREMGVRIAIDDFGTGFTSIGQLHRLPVDALKIDRSFVASGDPTVAELVRLIVGAAHAHHLDVVAEGVESMQEAAALRTFAVDRAQGFLFAPPAPPDAIASGWERAG